MRLHSIRLQNYRRHRDLTVDFSDQRVLVSGPNESGKSTLVEAIHRCLFYRHKSKAAGLLDRMQPRSGGDPEVTLVFSLGAIRYTLAKKFRGPSGSRAVLTDSQGRRDEGDAAEEALQQLLGINEVRGQLADAFNAQWAHLWVWQGSAHDEPGAALSESTTRQLRQQLQQQKGLGIIASRIDEAVQTAFQKRAEEIVGKAGKPKRSSRLGQAEQRLEAATHAVAAAAQQATGVRDAIDRLARADETITLSMGRKEEAESCLEPLRERIAEVDRLESVAARQQQDLEQACRKLEQLEATDTEIRTLAEELANLERQLAPDEQRLAAAKADVATKASAAVAADEALAGVRRELATLQDQRELFAAERIVLQANRELAALTELVERVEKAQETIDSLTRQLDEIPAVDEAAITALAAQEEQLKRSRLRVDLMATRIEVLAAEREVRLGDELLPKGTSSTISDVTELVIDATTRLLITPGGADSLADATQALASAEHELRRSLADHGVASLQAARDRLARRRHLLLQIDQREREISTLLGARSRVAVLEHHRESRRQLSEAQEKAAALRTREESQPATTTPESLEQLSDMERPLESAYRQLQGTLREHIHAREQASEAAKTAEHVMIQAADALEAARISRDTKRQKALALEEIHGGSEARIAAIVQARQERETAGAAVAASQQLLATFDRPTLAADLARFERVLEQAEAAIQSSREARAAAQGVLQSTGATDIHLTLAEAEASQETAAREHAAASREAQAILLLRDRFEQLARERADQVAAPLRQRAEDYLTSMFGPGTSVSLSITDSEPYLDLRIKRPGPEPHDFAFSELSGGTREQVAAAMRLAMAEILSERYGGCLPVVFDDAFTHSDPERIGMLQRMLDLAASRGLQVIVLSCNPTDYSMLGASEIDVSRLAAGPPPAR